MIHILVVEDDADLLNTVCRHLELNGFRASGFSSVRPACESMDREHYDLVISDIMLPEKNGFDFARELRTADPEIPILFMTAYDSSEFMRLGYRLGIDDYMVKPIRLDELVFRVEALLRRARIVSEKKLNVGNLLSYPERAFSRRQLSRLENGKTHVSKTAFDLSEQLVQVVLWHDQALKDKNLHLEIDPGDGISVTSDETLLRIVWNNLLSNAVRFTPEGGRICISTKSLSDAVQVSFRDSGCGIPEDAQSLIFENSTRQTSPIPPAETGSACPS